MIFLNSKGGRIGSHDGSESDENNASLFREGANSSQARRISSLLGRPRAGNDGNENGR
ncbi:hypothetical protein SBA3_200013 [Candidatus Sulfopaludibacter sp. SbA3]|nr:hypothetical protein SBA3_200013 [Candidatus Sulfopaludibacter sp. SbA3]